MLKSPSFLSHLIVKVVLLICPDYVHFAFFPVPLLLNDKSSRTPNYGLLKFLFL